MTNHSESKFDSRTPKRDKAMAESFRDMDLEKSPIENIVSSHIEGMFADAVRTYSLNSGDETPAQAMLLERIESELSTLLIDFVEQNIGDCPTCHKQRIIECPNDNACACENNCVDCLEALPQFTTTRCTHCQEHKDHPDTKCTTCIQ